MYTVYSIRLVCTLYKCTVCNTGSTLLYFLILQYLISLRSDFFAWFPLYIFYVGIFLSGVSPVILRLYYLFLSCWRLFFNLLQHLSLCSLFFLRCSFSLAADIFILHSRIFFATVSYLLLISANTVVSSLFITGITTVSSYCRFWHDLRKNVGGHKWLFWPLRNYYLIFLHSINYILDHKVSNVRFF